MIKTKTVFGQTVHYREEDYHVIKEVLENASYRRFNFDVMPGEHWLDLGANIGAFALYCKHRGATATCYEPEGECFVILQRNVGDLPGFAIRQIAVTANRANRIQFYKSGDESDHSRGTIFSVNGRFRATGEVLNLFAGDLKGESYDGIKMDIEGAEGSILDEWLLPATRKLVFEYHTSRDHSVENLRRRIATIRERFTHVNVPPEYNKAIASGATAIYTHAGPGRVVIRFDRLIFAWN